MKGCRVCIVRIVEIKTGNRCALVFFDYLNLEGDHSQIPVFSAAEFGPPRDYLGLDVKTFEWPQPLSAIFLSVRPN